jgi:hypothetical protein
MAGKTSDTNAVRLARLRYLNLRATKTHFPAAQGERCILPTIRMAPQAPDMKSVARSLPPSRHAGCRAVSAFSQGPASATGIGLEIRRHSPGAIPPAGVEWQALAWNKTPRHSLS